MNPLIGYGLVTGLGSLASGLANSYIGYNQSKGLMDYQYQLQQKAIDAQNLYNSPAEQMKRLAEAHLNPNLVYGSGVDGNQSSAASPSIASRRGELGNPIGDAVTAYMGAQQMSAGLDKTQQDIAESRSRVALQAAQTLGVLSDNKLKDATLDDNIKIASQKLANMLADEQRTYAEVGNLAAKRVEIMNNAQLLAEKQHLTQQQALTEIVKREAMRARIAVDNKTCEKIAAEIPFIKAGTNLRELAAKIQNTSFEANKQGEKWLAENPRIAIVVNLLERLLADGKTAGITTP